MPKIERDGKIYDSYLEIQYYDYLVDLLNKGEVLNFEYHPKEPIYLNKKNRYYPDFIVEYNDRIEIVEDKGYSQYSYIKDNYIHQTMLEMNESDLRIYVMKNGWTPKDKQVVYKKIKYLKSFGWVDWEFKNPNTIANKRKAKITELQTELKELKQYHKDCERYFGYVRSNHLLNKKQKEWKSNFEKEHIYKEDE